MKGWIVIITLSLWCATVYGAEDSGKFSTEVWQAVVERSLNANFSGDPEVISNTLVQVLEGKDIVALTRFFPENNSARVIFLSRGFTDLIQTEDELLFFLAHEVGHSKMDAIGVTCDMCGNGNCEELAADRFAMDLLEARGHDVCGGKTLLLKMMLQGADVDSDRLKQLREGCPHSYKAAD